MVDPVIIYTDGACKGNPGKGGWGAWLQYKGHEKEIYGGEPHTTNNRMELMAAIQALENLNKPCIVTLYTDSSYLKEGINKWLENWKKRGWKTTHKKAIKNEDLWRRLDLIVKNHKVTWKWVKSHSGNYGNDKADSLANKGVDSL